jgi:hypothetical protein
MTCAPAMPEREEESRTTPAKAANCLPVESLLTESGEKTGIPILSPERARDVMHPAAANRTAIMHSFVREGRSMDDFTSEQKGLSLSNALVQLQARYHHRGVTASEKCLSAAAFVRSRAIGLDQIDSPSPQRDAKGQAR